MGSLVYPVIQRVQLDARIRSRCVWFALITQEYQPWLHNNERHKWAMIPLASNTWSENSLLLEPQLHTEHVCVVWLRNVGKIEARICFCVVNDLYQKVSKRVAESHRWRWKESYFDSILCLHTSSQMQLFSVLTALWPVLWRLLSAAYNIQLRDPHCKFRSWRSTLEPCKCSRSSYSACFRTPLLEKHYSNYK